MYRKTLKITILLPILYLVPIYLWSQPVNSSHSTITLPIEANLTQLESYLNTTIPDTLSTIHDIGRVCVKPQYLKTKGIPKCRMKDFKISCEEQWIKIQTIPEIKCDIEGWVKRDGRLLVSGTGDTLNFSFPIKTKITTKSHIDGVATAAAVVNVLATPEINDDWSISMEVEPTFTWSKKPTISLLNGIEISIQSSVEKKLQKRIQKFVRKLPKRLAKIKLKEKMTVAWDKMQEPIKLDKRSKTYLYFNPHSISYSGFRIINNQLQSTISIQGKTDIVLGAPTKKRKKVALPHLNLIPFKEGLFTFNLPVSVAYQELVDMLNKKFIHGYQIDFTQNALPGNLTMTNPKIKKTHSNQIQVSAHIHYDNHTTWLQNIEGEITFQGRPTLNKENQTIILEELSYSTKTNSEMFDALVNIAEIKPLKYYLSHLMQFELSDEIDKGIKKANKALKSFSKKSITLSAHLNIASIQNLHLHDEKLTLYTQLSGIVSASINLKAGLKPK